LIPLFAFPFTTHCTPWQHPPSLSTTAIPRHPTAHFPIFSYPPLQLRGQEIVRDDTAAGLALTASLYSPSERGCFTFILKEALYAFVKINGTISLLIFFSRVTYQDFHIHPIPYPRPQAIQENIIYVKPSSVENQLRALN